MDWKRLIADLTEAGFTQAQIATECGVAQPTISDLSRLADRSPNFELGSKLVALHTALQARKGSDAAANPDKTAPVEDTQRIPVMLLGGRREENHASSFIDTIDAGDVSPDEKIDAIGKLVSFSDTTPPG